MSGKQSNWSKPQDLPKRLKLLAKDAGKGVTRELVDISKDAVTELLRIATFQK